MKAHPAKLIFLLFHTMWIAFCIYSVVDVIILLLNPPVPSLYDPEEWGEFKPGLNRSLVFHSAFIAAALIALIFIAFKRAVGWWIALVYYVLLLGLVLFNLVEEFEYYRENISAVMGTIAATRIETIWFRVQAIAMTLGPDLGLMLFLLIMIWMILQFRKRGALSRNGAF